jgi:hypothetical protein
MWLAAEVPLESHSRGGGGRGAMLVRKRWRLQQHARRRLRVDVSVVWTWEPGAALGDLMSLAQPVSGFENRFLCVAGLLKLVTGQKNILTDTPEINGKCVSKIEKQSPTGP